MARLRYTRRIPIAAQGGTAVKLAPPSAMPSPDGWSMLRATPSAEVATATSLTLTALIDNGAESSVLTTANRLDGLLFEHAGAFYRITNQTAGGVLTFTPGLATATAVTNVIRVQADLPMMIGQLMLQTVATDILYSYDQDTTASGGEYFTIGVGMSKLLYDNDIWTPAHPSPVFMVGAVAGTAEVEVTAA